MPATGDPGFDVRDRAAYLPEPDALVLADLHLGKAAMSNVAFPIGAGSAIAERVEALVDRFEPREVVLAGDVLHSFSTLPDGAAEAFDRLRDAIEDRGSRLTVLRGNHDTHLDSLADPADERRLPDGTLVCHGHEEPDGDADRYVVGHDHPAIEIEGRRRPCVLLGEGVYRDADVLMLPAFTELAAGTEVNRLAAGDALSPLLAVPDRFRPIVWDADAGETYAFPPLGSFREFL